MKAPLAFLACLAVTPAALAQDPAPEAPVPSLPPLTVTLPLGAAPPLQVPASVDVVYGDQLRNANLQVNLSEAMGSVPGLQIQNRQNYA